MHYYIPVLLALFSSCAFERPSPPPTSESKVLRLFTSSEDPGLRAFTGSEEMYLYGSEGDVKWKAKATLNGREWLMDKPHKVVSNGKLFGLVSPQNGPKLSVND